MCVCGVHVRVLVWIVCVGVRVGVGVGACAYVCACVFVSVCGSACAFACACTHACASTWVRVCVFVEMHLCRACIEMAPPSICRSGAAFDQQNPEP